MKVSTVWSENIKVTGIELAFSDKNLKLYILLS